MKYWNGEGMPATGETFEIQYKGEYQRVTRVESHDTQSMTVKDVTGTPIYINNVPNKNFRVCMQADNPQNKYSREIKPNVYVDVYDVLKAFNVTCPAMQHAIKKCLASGQRGVKDSVQDKNEAIASINRSIELE